MPETIDKGNFMFFEFDKINLSKKINPKISIEIDKFSEEVLACKKA